MPSKCSICKQTGHNKLSCPENNTLEITIPRMCPICYVNITKKKGFVKTECGHTFCYKCFIKWTYNNVTCPLCRKVIKKPNKVDVVEIEVPIEVEVPVEVEVIRPMIKYIEKSNLETHIIWLLWGILLTYIFM